MRSSYENESIMSPSQSSCNNKLVYISNFKYRSRPLSEASINHNKLSEMLESYRISENSKKKRPKRRPLSVKS